ncbi:putative protein LRRC37A5P, partial [Chelydra serpentina]
ESKCCCSSEINISIISICYFNRDLSCNKILFIETHAFEPLPFLQYINLGGNLITELRYGTFQAWHGMQFLQKLVLSHNPLSIIADTSFFELPSLKYLDLGATQVTQKTFQTLLMTSLRLETLILPNNMACCLCQMKENIEILCKTIKLHCEHLCATNSSLCVHEEPLEKMHEELMKVLQSRKLNASIVLNLEPEEPLLTNSDNEIPMLTDSQYQPKIDMDLNKSGNLLPGLNYLFFKHLTKKGEITDNPSENKDSSLDDILPSIHQANETHWKHQKESSGFPYALSGSSSPDNYSVQGDLFEAELNNRLHSLIPNQAVRNLISHVIRTLKMDCTEPRVQLACAKLISKTGLLMKLFSEREDIKETSSLWRTYLWENGNVPNDSAHQRKASKKDSEELSPEAPQYSYGNKLLLAISVTVVIMIIIAVICLIEICSQRSAASSQSTHDNKPQSIWSFQKLSQERKSKISSEAIHKVPGVSESSSMEKPLWLRDMYLPLDSIRKKSMAQKLYDRESSDEEEIFNRADVR